MKAKIVRRKKKKSSVRDLSEIANKWQMKRKLLQFSMAIIQPILRASRSFYLRGSLEIDIIWLKCLQKLFSRENG